MDARLQAAGATDIQHLIVLADEIPEPLTPSYVLLVAAHIAHAVRTDDQLQYAPYSVQRRTAETLTNLNHHLLQEDGLTPQGLHQYYQGFIKFVEAASIDTGRLDLTPILLRYRLAALLYPTPAVLSYTPNDSTEVLVPVSIPSTPILEVLASHLRGTKERHTTLGLHGHIIWSVSTLVGEATRRALAESLRDAHTPGLPVVDMMKLESSLKP